MTCASVSKYNTDEVSLENIPSKSELWKAPAIDWLHEIGHALNLALTGDVTVIPDGFDEFNERLNISWTSIVQKQEAFADVASFAILNSEELEQHLPTQFSAPMRDCFDTYISEVIDKYYYF